MKKIMAVVMIMTILLTMGICVLETGAAKLQYTIFDKENDISAAGWQVDAGNAGNENSKNGVIYGLAKDVPYNDAAQGDALIPASPSGGTNYAMAIITNNATELTGDRTGYHRYRNCVFTPEDGYCLSVDFYVDSEATTTSGRIFNMYHRAYLGDNLNYYLSKDTPMPVWDAETKTGTYGTVTWEADTWYTIKWYMYNNFAFCSTIRKSDSEAEIMAIEKKQVAVPNGKTSVRPYQNSICPTLNTGTVFIDNIMLDSLNPIKITSPAEGESIGERFTVSGTLTGGYTSAEILLDDAKIADISKGLDDFSVGCKLPEEIGYGEHTLTVLANYLGDMQKSASTTVNFAPVGEKVYYNGLPAENAISIDDYGKFKFYNASSINTGTFTGQSYTWQKKENWRTSGTAESDLENPLNSSAKPLVLQFLNSATLTSGTYIFETDMAFSNPELSVFGLEGANDYSDKSISKWAISYWSNTNTGNKIMKNGAFCNGTPCIANQIYKITVEVNIDTKTFTVYVDGSPVYTEKRDQLYNLKYLYFYLDIHPTAADLEKSAENGMYESIYVSGIKIAKQEALASITAKSYTQGGQDAALDGRVPYKAESITVGFSASLESGYDAENVVLKKLVGSNWEDVEATVTVNDTALTAAPTKGFNQATEYKLVISNLSFNGVAASRAYEMRFKTNGYFKGFIRNGSNSVSASYEFPKAEGDDTLPAAVTVILAAYNENTLTSVSIQKLELAEDDDNTFTLTMPDTKGGTVIESFIWDELTPIIEASVSE